MSEPLSTMPDERFRRSTSEIARLRTEDNLMASPLGHPLACPTQSELDWLIHSGVDIMTLVRPIPMRIASGIRAEDGLFEPDPSGDRWLTFEETGSNDLIFWQPRLRSLTSWTGRAFALGEAVIDQAATYSFHCNLNIFADPLEWLQAKRDGIVVLPEKWPLAFDRLRDVPRIAIAEQLLPLYRRHMKPVRLPELFVTAAVRCAA